MVVSPQRARFLFVVCQVGAEKTVKSEVAQHWPDFRFAYSRPGFLTFKLPEQIHPAPDFNLASAFARAYGFSLGKVSGSDPAVAARQAWDLLGDRPLRRIHVSRAIGRNRAITVLSPPSRRRPSPSMKHCGPRVHVPRPWRREITAATRPMSATGSATACWSSPTNGGSVITGRDPSLHAGRAVFPLSRRRTTW